MTFTCTKCGGECKYAVAPPVCPYCQDSGLWHDRGPSHFAQHVPIVDQPEAYAKMREAAGLCSDCGGDRHAHMSNCPRIAAAVAQMPLPQPTAYDRDQQALRDRVELLEERADANADYTHNELHQRLRKLELIRIQTDARFDNTLRRIDQLERERAVIKPRMVVSPDHIRTPTEFAPCGCPVSHQADCRLKHLVSASPAAAYPPLPDEGT